jgi:spermidine synthase
MRSPAALACLFLSGSAGLIYEVCWIRRASLVFGSTTWSLSTVLAVFFLGLATGSWWFGRVSQRTRNPLRVFALLEIALALLAVLSLPLFDVIEGLYGHVFRSFADAPVVLAAARVALVAAILLPPTILMGGTLPLFCRQIVRDERRIAGTVAFLYALNTAGAALGCAAAGFLLIPELGVTWSVRSAAVLNLSAGLVVLALRPSALAAATEVASDAETAPRRELALVPVLFFLSGFVVLGLEVLWTRYLALLVRNTVYTYTLTLTAVLVGIVLGSLLGPLILDRPIRRARLFGALQVVLGLGVLATLMVPADTWRGAGEHLGIYFAVLLPPAVLSGLAFPLAVRMVTSDPALAGIGVGRMAAFNTLGGIAGSLAVGFGLLPAFGLQVSLLVLTAVSVAIGCAAWWALDDARTGPRAAATALAVIVWVALPPAFGTRLPADFLADPGALIAHREGLEANLAVVRKEDDVHLEIDRWWQGQRRKGHQVMAAHVPMLIHPDPRRVLVVGVGVGQTSKRFLMYDIERLECIDIEPRVFDVVREHFDSDWMDDERVVLIEADGRNHLAHSDATYDVISLELGQLFRPGVAAFYTEEFYRDVRARLAPGGVLSQFVPLPFLDADQLRTVLATFLAVFPESALWYNTSELLLLGVDAEQLKLDEARLELLGREGDVRADLAFSQWGGPANWLNRRGNFLGAWLVGPAGLAALAADAPLLGDDRPVLEYATRRAHVTEANELPLVELLREYLSPPGELPGLELSDDERRAVAAAREANLNALVAAVHVRNFQARKTSRPPSQLRHLLEAALAASPNGIAANRLLGGVLVLEGNTTEAETVYRRALSIRPDDPTSNRGMALVLHGTQRIHEAIPYYRALLAARPDDAEAHNNLAAALGQTGQLEEAIVHFEETLRLRPDFDHARRNLEKTRQALEQQRP